MNTRKFIASAFGLVVVASLCGAAAAAAKCESQLGTCKCSTKEGIIDLSPIDKPNSPIQWTDPAYTAYEYRYNPCTGFSCGPTSDVAICEIFSGSTYMSPADARTAKFKYNDAGGNNYIEYGSGIGVTSQINLVCDTSKIGEITAGPVSPFSNPLTFTLSSKYNCPAAASGGGGGLSVGSILLIIFFSLVAAYLIGGVLFLIFVKKESGLNAIPNRSFWIESPALIRDGCVLTYGTIVALVNRNRQGYTSA